MKMFPSTNFPSIYFQLQNKKLYQNSFLNSDVYSLKLTSSSTLLTV